MRAGSDGPAATGLSGRERVLVLAAAADPVALRELADSFPPTVAYGYARTLARTLAAVLDPDGEAPATSLAFAARLVPEEVHLADEALVALVGEEARARAADPPPAPVVALAPRTFSSRRAPLLRTSLQAGSLAAAAITLLVLPGLSLHAPVPLEVPTLEERPPAAPAVAAEPRATSGDDADRGMPAPDRGRTRATSRPAATAPAATRTVQPVRIRTTPAPAPAPVARAPRRPAPPAAKPQPAPPVRPPRPAPAPPAAPPPPPAAAAPAPAAPAPVRVLAAVQPAAPAAPASAPAPAKGRPAAKGRPPGQAKKEASLPPGQAKKQTATAPQPPEPATAETAPEELVAQAAAMETAAEPATQAEDAPTNGRGPDGQGPPGKRKR